MFTSDDMARIAEGWRAAVVDFSKRNNLLFFKSSSKTLDLTDADLSQVEEVLQGRTASLSQLIGKGETELLHAQKVTQKLLRDQNRLLEELGVSPVFVAIGFCSWVESEASGNTDDDKTTRAPIFLLQVEIDHQRSAKEPFKLKPGQEIKLNGVIAHAAEAAGLDFDTEEILDELPDSPCLEDIYELIDDLEYKLDELQDFSTNHEVQLAAFGYQDEAIYRDLCDIEALMSSDLVRAMAGDGDAISKVQEQSLIPLDAPDTGDLSDENLILEADASQHQVISSALAGNVVVVEGPPGTGKSQTISNLLAESLARGKRVLFVAQKRAAITAVTSRLEKIGLDRLVLDIHEQHRGPQVAAQLISSFENMNRAQEIDKSEVEEELEEYRTKLTSFRRAAFIDEVALGKTLSDWREHYFACPSEVRPVWRLPDDFIRGLSVDSLKALLKHCEDLAGTGGLADDFRSKADSWNVDRILSNEDLQECNSLARALLAGHLPALKELVSTNSKSEPKTLPNFIEKAKATAFKGLLLEGAPKLMTKGLGHEAVKQHLVNLGAGKSAQPGIGARIGSRLQLTTLISGSVERKIKFLEYLDFLLTVKKSAIPAAPMRVEGKTWEELIAGITELEGMITYLQGIQLSKMSVAGFEKHLNSLLKDSRQYQIPLYWRLRSELEKQGLADSIPNLEAAYRLISAPEQLSAVVLSSISQSQIESALSSDDRLKGVSASSLDEAIRAFNLAEMEHYRLNGQNIKRLAAAHLQEACNKFPSEYKYLLGEAKKKRAHKPLRTLIAKAPNLMLAANPIWAMSPIQASQYLTRAKNFDLVIFDEASQVKPEMAIPSIIRGKSVVIAGDSNQLPPTNFFAGGGLVAETTSETQYFEDTTKDSESILEAAERVVGNARKRLSWHYRSRDERLIALSNLEIYGNSLTTFPASDTPDALSHVLVKGGKHKAVVSGIDNNEIEKTISLVKDHFKTRSLESLGVITFGAKHLEKLEIALEIERAKDSAFDRWLDGNEKEPFFMKNLERVQGDERDAIIIFTGYGRSSDGKISMQWGPLTQEVGRRRLNVAISRAKRRMTLVSTMSSAELGNANVRAGTGLDLYLKFLEYMERDGEGYRNSAHEVALNPFELDIKKKMEAAGLQVTTQFGVGNYRLDFVIHDPSDPSKFLLAVEADGASYHSGHTARERDRLRQLALEDRGWKFHRIWSTDWFRDPDTEISKLLAVVDSSASSARRLIDDAADYADELDESLEEEAPVRVGPAPQRYRSNTIDNYPVHHLEQVVRYIMSDKRLYTDDEIVEEAARTWLGLSKLTQKARGKLLSVIARVRRG